MMPTKIGTYGSTAGYGAGYGIPGMTATKTRAVPRDYNKVVRANTLVLSQKYVAQKKPAPSNTPFDPNVLATGYSFLTDDAMYANVGKPKVEAVEVDAGADAPPAKPMWPYLVGFLALAGGGYYLYSRSKKSK
jgi:hypothetical protein